MPRIGIKQWKLLIAAATAHEEELPQIGPFKAALEEALEELRSIRNRQANLKKLQQEASRDLKDQVSSGAEMAARLKYFVRASLGRKDERLADFGMKVFGRPSEPQQPERRQNGSPGYH